MAQATYMPIKSKYAVYESRLKTFEPGYFLLSFLEENVTGLSNCFLLVFSKNFMSSACLLCDI